MPDLTREDINQLIDAVETWSRTNEVDGSKMLSMMMGNMGDPQKSKEMIEAFNDEMRRKSASKREQGILLQAKLIQLRDKMDISRAADFLKTGRE
jgi:hypothetical protein